VIGGGPAGLAAAKFLADAGRSALVLEKRPILGGKVSSWRDRDGDLLETGLHAFRGGYDTVHQLLRDVGIGHHLLWQPQTLTFALPPHWANRVGSDPVFEAFRFLDAPAPFNGIGALLNSRFVFNAWEKLLFAAGTLPALAGDDDYAERYDDVTYAAWHRKRGMSEHMLRTFFAPLALASNFTPVDQISAEAMLRVIASLTSSRDASRVGFLDGPPSERLIEPIAEHVRERGIRIDANARIAELVFASGRAIGVRTDDGRTYEAENIILATPVHDAAQLLPVDMLRDPLVAGVGKLTSSPVINGHFWFDRPISRYTNLIDSPGTLMPVHADLGQAAPGYGWPKKSFLEVTIAPADDLMPLDDETIIERVMADMTQLYPLATKETLVKAKLVRVPKSVYRASPGAERLRPGSRTPVENLFLAGCYTNHRFPASIEGAMRSARAAVDAVLERSYARA
jgi:15-cis-phytoene desaturase